MAGIPQRRAGPIAKKYYNYALSWIRMANTIFLPHLYDAGINIGLDLLEGRYRDSHLRAKLI
jgi:hypothetical protein